MRKRYMILPVVLITAFLSAAAVPAQAQGTGGDWEFNLTVYAWVPRLDGTLNFDVPGSDDNRIRVYPGDLVKNLQFTIPVAFGARKGRWGFLIDTYYVKEGNSKNGTVQVPLLRGRLIEYVDVGADLTLKTLIVNGVATYTMVETEGGRLDFLFGVRYLSVKTDLHLNLQGYSPIPRPYRDTDFSASRDGFNAIVGLKGEARFGGNWILPYYVDAGFGDSNFTWQAMAAVGYRWEVCDLSLGYRHLSFNQGSKDRVHDLNVSGATLALKFKW